MDRAKLWAEGKKPEKLALAFQYAIDGSKVVNIESEDRELPFETFFAQDNDQMSVSTMILDAILKVCFLNALPLFVLIEKSKMTSYLTKVGC